MYRDHSVAVVMPIHNEEAHAVRAIGRVPDYVDLVIAVDDGSGDGTWEQLSRIESGRLVRLRHAKNRGVGAATKTGYQHAIGASIDLIAVMDGDGQMDGRDLWRLLDRSIDGADYVKGNRFLHHSLAAMPLSRLAGNTIFSWLTRRATGLVDPVDAQCGYAVIRHSALSRIKLNDLYDRYGFLNDMLFATERAGLRVESVPVRCIYGQEVSGINPLKVVPAILWLICRRYIDRLLTTWLDGATVTAASVSRLVSRRDGVIREQ
ncbi:MAG TPA: glycosyltransferase family 2 protein [Blastocatellia bacterium]|nr:glycosyltransferase family 2 protein [Blastocatellia bacterium]